VTVTFTMLKERQELAKEKERETITSFAWKWSQPSDEVDCWCLKHPGRETKDIKAIVILQHCQQQLIHRLVEDCASLPQKGWPLCLWGDCNNEKCERTLCEFVWFLLENSLRSNDVCAFGRGNFLTRRDATSDDARCKLTTTVDTLWRQVYRAFCSSPLVLIHTYA
jgi:hypothetical protein